MDRYKYISWEWIGRLPVREPAEPRAELWPGVWTVDQAGACVSWAVAAAGRWRVDLAGWWLAGEKEVERE